jgi:hypothetical protein
MIQLGQLGWDAGNPFYFLLETSLKIGNENASINKTELWLLLARMEGNVSQNKAASVRWPGN